MPIKPLSFKGDKKPKKRKHRDRDRDDDDDNDNSNAANPTSTGAALVTDNPDDDSWTAPDSPSDLTGPVIIILPTVPPTCLAADANGNVFASMLENLVEGHPETAEPHDVRQVWVANQIPGTGGQTSFKGSHGGYLSCDGMGVLGARREARGVEEGFVVSMVENEEDQGRARGKERWMLRTTTTAAAAASAAASNTGEEGKGDGATYVCAVVEGKGKNADGGEYNDADNHMPKKVSISLRGDAAEGNDGTGLIIKMQARFKPRVQQDKDTRAREKVSRQELEHAVGRKLEDDEVRRLKRARKNGTYHEEILDVRVKGKHDKFA